MSKVFSKKKLWLINYTGRKGGGPLDAISMTRGLINNGENVAAIVSSEVENLSEWKKLKLIKLVVIDTYNNKSEFLFNSFLFSFRQGKQIRQELKDINIDVIYCPMVTFWTGKINRLFPETKKLEVLHDPVPHSGEKSIISLSVDREIKRADIIAVHSEKFVEYVTIKYKKQTIWFPLGRHSEYSRIEKHDKGFHYHEEKINFLFFGTFSKYKGLDILAKAYKNVEAEMGKDKCNLYIVGSGDFSLYRDSYEGVESYRVINDWIPDEEVESYFKGENLICVCPYVDGTQSGAVMLALEYQVPLIVTDVGGIAEQIKHGKTGVVIKPDNVNELSESMIMLASDRKKREEMKTYQKMDLQRFDWNNLAKVLMKAIYE